ncbi:hypothetical protein CEXT_571601 [Caerostris extrusa]|uniref:Uncharacterized protein n=1 Tax=Caerostris extrusa TaxID=172846 RepID=A0AAV4WEA7_CAEEX|nr:hypothetical protein CEXT_571601 [Caerostris extrusa]
METRYLVARSKGSTRNGSSISLGSMQRFDLKRKLVTCWLEADGRLGIETRYFLARSRSLSPRYSKQRFDLKWSFLSLAVASQSPLETPTCAAPSVQPTGEHGESPFKTSPVFPWSLLIQPQVAWK